VALRLRIGAVLDRAFDLEVKHGCCPQHRQGVDEGRDQRRKQTSAG
jgi:hypothetical protein